MMDLSEYHVSPGDLSVSPRMIAKLMGVDPENIPEPYGAIIERELEEVSGYDQIKGGLNVIDDIEVKTDDQELVLEKTSFFPGRQVIRYLRHSERVVLFVCTAGEKVSSRSRELMDKGQFLEGYVCDLVGSLLVEEAMSTIHENFRESIRNQGESSTNLYSPGYCDWDVAEQHKLFSFFPGDFCGVRLSSSALMYPIKSVSGVFGIGRNVRFQKYVCNACSKVDCLYRNLKYTV